MPDDFRYDVFLSYSDKDKAVVRPLAERLRGDGLEVWFDEWEVKPGDSIPKRIEEGLENSRVLVLCMSAAAFGSDWAKLESYTFRFRDPLNKEGRFIPLRLDNAPVPGSLVQYLYVNWRRKDRKVEYPRLLEACRWSTNQGASHARAGQSSTQRRPDTGSGSGQQAPATAGKPHSGKIFISYRRDDTAAIAGRLYDRLEARFGKRALFFDIDSIPLGINFRTHITSTVSQCGVLLAVIGDRWLGDHAQGCRRIDDPDDFIRIEIGAALSLEVPVIIL